MGYRWTKPKCKYISPPLKLQEIKLLYKILNRWKSAFYKFKNSRFRNNAGQRRETNATELNDFLGLLLLTSAFKSNSESIASIFLADGTGCEFFRLVMAAKRFAVLLACLRVDTHEERMLKIKTNSAAAISHTLEKFNKHPQSTY